MQYGALQIQMQCFLKTRYRQITGTIKMQTITGNYWHITTLYQQITGSHMACIMNHIHIYGHLSIMLGYIPLPAINAGNDKITGMLEMRSCCQAVGTITQVTSCNSSLCATVCASGTGTHCLCLEA